MQEKQDPKEIEYAEALLKLSKNSVNPNKATIGEYLSTPMKRFPFRRPQDPGQAFETLQNIDKKKLLVFIVIFLAVFMLLRILSCNQWNNKEFLILGIHPQTPNMVK